MSEINELLESFKELSKRLEAIEKITGVRKSIVGQDEDETEQTKWPSLSGG